MGAARRAGHAYFLRFLVVAFALPGLPAAGVFLTQAAGLPGFVSFGAGVLMLVAWRFLARQILGKFMSLCPRCGRRNATIDSVDGMAILVCPDCGWKGDTGYDFGDHVG